MTAVEWLFRNLWDQPKDKITWWDILDKANRIHNNDMSRAYTEGFKRYKYIRELSTGVIPNDSEPIPDDFDTYYQKTYGK